MKRTTWLLILGALQACGVEGDWRAQAHVIPAEEDAEVRAGLEREENFGAVPTIQVKNYEDTPQWGWAFRRAYLSFDLTGRDVEGAAFLALFANLKDGVEPITLELYAVEGDWSEDGLTWETQPGRGRMIGTLTSDHALADVGRFEEEGAWAISSDLGPALREAGSRLSIRIENPTFDEVLFFTNEHPSGPTRGPRVLLED
jgi:hypothetical protein